MFGIFSKRKKPKDVQLGGFATFILVRDTKAEETHFSKHDTPKQRSEKDLGNFRFVNVQTLVL